MLNYFGQVMKKYELHKVEIRQYTCTDVYQEDGCATLKMIVETIVMKTPPCVVNIISVILS